MTDSKANEVSALPSLGRSQERPMVIIPSFPSSKVLEVMGRAVVLFAQSRCYDCRDPGTETYVAIDKESRLLAGCAA